MQAFDVLLLLFKGVAIASIPLAAVWVGRAGRDGDRLARLAWVTVFLTFDLVVFGGFTRLTDSGLGCPDWPGCYDRANPFMASDAIAAAERAMPDGPVTWGKAWIEMIHRYLAMAVGLLIVAMVVVSVMAARRARRTGAPPTAYPATAAALLGVGTTGLLVSDVLYGLGQLEGAWQIGGASDLGWVVFYIAWGAAGLHPSIAALADTVIPPP